MLFNASLKGLVAPKIQYIEGEEVARKVLYVKESMTIDEVATMLDNGRQYCHEIRRISQVPEL